MAVSASPLLQLFESDDLRSRACPTGTRYALSANEAALASDADTVLVIGAFDGLHVGHRALVSAAVDDARRRGVQCVAVTFDPDPADIVAKAAPSAHLLRGQDRVVGLLRLGTDVVHVLDFTSRVAKLSPEGFVRRVICAEMRPVSVHVGKNFRFGHGAEGSVESLRELGEMLGFCVHAHPIVRAKGDQVSATRIRGLIGNGEVSLANELLGRLHYVRGVVVHGRGEGTSFGFPTANVHCDMNDCMPAEGVYACYVTHGSASWPAAANVGAPKTFDMHQQAFLEANLVGFEGDIYGEEVAVSFVSWLRNSRAFESVEELERTVLGNIAWVREHLGEVALEVHC